MKRIIFCFLCFLFFGYSYGQVPTSWLQFEYLFNYNLNDTSGNSRHITWGSGQYTYSGFLQLWNENQSNYLNLPYSYVSSMSWDKTRSFFYRYYNNWLDSTVDQAIIRWWATRTSYSSFNIYQRLYQWYNWCYGWYNSIWHWNFCSSIGSIITWSYVNLLYVFSWNNYKTYGNNWILVTSWNFEVNNPTYYPITTFMWINSTRTIGRDSLNWNSYQNSWFIIDDIRLWNYNLSSSDVASLYNVYYIDPNIYTWDKKYYFDKYVYTGNQWSSDLFSNLLENQYFLVKNWTGINYTWTFGISWFNFYDNREWENYYRLQYIWWQYYLSWDSVKYNMNDLYKVVEYNNDNQNIYITIKFYLYDDNNPLNLIYTSSAIWDIYKWNSNSLIEYDNFVLYSSWNYHYDYSKGKIIRFFSWNDVLYSRFGNNSICWWDWWSWIWDYISSDCEDDLYPINMSWLSYIYSKTSWEVYDYFSLIIKQNSIILDTFYYDRLKTSYINNMTWQNIYQNYASWFSINNYFANCPFSYIHSWLSLEIWWWDFIGYTFPVIDIMAPIRCWYNGYYKGYEMLSWVDINIYRNAVWWLNYNGKNYNFENSKNINEDMVYLFVGFLPLLWFLFYMIKK
jgi:hypothetical protein